MSTISKSSVASDPIKILVIGVLILITGCVSSDDSRKSRKRALAGGATSTAIGVATGVGGAALAARALVGATSRVISGKAMDTVQEDSEEKDDTKAIK